MFLLGEGKQIMKTSSSPFAREAPCHSESVPLPQFSIMTDHHLVPHCHPLPLRALLDTDIPPTVFLGEGPLSRRINATQGGGEKGNCLR